MSPCRLSASKGDIIIIIIIIFTMMTMMLVIMILMVTFLTHRMRLNEYDHDHDGDHHHLTCGVILTKDQHDDLILLPRYALKKELDSKNNSESMYQLGNLALSIQVRVIALPFAATF